MMRLKSKLLSLNADKTVKVKVYTPANCDEVRIPFKKDKVAKVVGTLAQVAPPSEQDDGQLMAGVLVQNGFDLSLMAPDDLREYAGLTTTTITCKQHLTLSSASMDLIRWALESTFGAIERVGANAETKEESNGELEEMPKKESAEEEIPLEDAQTFLIMGCVILRYHSRNREIELEWEGNMMNDGVADAVMAVLLTVESSPASVKREYSRILIAPLLLSCILTKLLESAKHNHHHHHHEEDVPSLPNPHSNIGPDERLDRLLMMLEAQFGSEITPIEKPRVPTDLAMGKTEGSDGIKEEDLNEERIADIESAELDRLHALGIPIPGIEIKVDKHVARVWLENLEVECANAVLRDRVRIVVERAVETVAGLWAASSMPREVVVPDELTKGQIEMVTAMKKAAAIESQG